MTKPQSPAFDQVLEKFQEAMTDDQDVGQDVVARLINLLKGDNAVNAAKVEAALFPNEPTQSTSK